MAPRIRWQDPLGLKTINTIVKTLIPTWTNGLHPVQLELVSAVLDGQDILCCTATGDGKSAAFAIPCLVLMEYNTHPHPYPAGLPTRKRPIGIVITPTKGLANNTVFELSKLNVSAFSYCHETLSEARKAGTRLADVIKECTRWQVICVDPEHLRDKEWRDITESPIFRSNVLFACVDEVHLINVWGLSFRTAFTTIGAFLRGRFPASISVVGLSATLEPGPSTVSVCKSLGFFEGNFKFIRRSNERPNTQFTIQFTTHGLNGEEFPDILPYLASGRKTIIHCRALDQVSRVYAYIWRLQPDGMDKLIRTRMYHSINPPEYNEETIRLLENDPRCQTVIATVAFSNGLNAKSLLDSLSLGFASTFDESWQEKGRVGRDPDTIGRGVIFAHRSIIKAAEGYLKSLVTPPIQRNNTSKTKTKTPQILDKSKALLIVEKTCYISRINICYGNPSLDPSRPNLHLLDCVAAGRRLPCSLCLSRQGGDTITAFSSSSPDGSLPILTLPKTVIIPESPAKMKDKLNKKERAVAEKHLLVFGDSIRQKERHSNSHKFRPRSSYFPLDVLSSILDKLFVIHFPSHLKDLLDNSWLYYDTHGHDLYNSITNIQACIITGRSKARDLTKSKQREKQQLAMIIGEEEENEAPSQPETEIEPEELIGQSSSRKRQAMEDVTNAPKRRRAPRAPQPSVAQMQEEYGPRYQTRRRPVIAEDSCGTGGKENSVRRVSLRSRNN